MSAVRRRSTIKVVRAAVGHNAEHEASHRLAEKVSFAAAEHTLVVGEGFVARVLDDLKLKRLAAAAPARWGAASTDATARSEAALKRLHPWRFVPARPRTAAALAFDAVVAAVPRGAVALIALLRCVVPALGCYLVCHMARADARRAAREWREKRLKGTTALFAVACVCDGLDAAIHGAVVVAHLTAHWHLVSHAAVHALESLAIQLAAAAFLAMITGEVCSNNRAGRAPPAKKTKGD